MGYLRLMLAIFVILSHAGGIEMPFGDGKITLYNFGGRNAVGIFYMISGFYMSMILTDKYKNSLKTFYLNRALRIFPTYWFVLILGFFFINLDYQSIIKALEQTSLGARIYFYFSNIFIFGSDVAYLVSTKPDGLIWDPFSLSNTHNGFTLLAIPTVFTIGLELLFYIVSPFMVKSMKLNLSILFTVLIFHIYMIATNNTNVVYQYHLFPSSFLYFSMGILSHKMYYEKGMHLTKYKYLLFAIIATLIMLIQPLLPNILLFLFPFVLPYLFELTKYNKIDRFIGDLSYPLYIVHYSVLKYCWAQGVNQQKIGLIVLVASLFIAILIHLFLEKPIDKYREIRASKLLGK